MVTGALPSGFSHLVLRTVVLASQSHWSSTDAPRGSSALNMFLGSLHSTVCPSGSTYLQGILGSPTWLTKPAPSRGSVHAVHGWRGRWVEARWGWAGRPPHQLSFQKNVIHTAKYSVFSFLPLNLYEQFHRFSNLYFLLIILLSKFP